MCVRLRARSSQGAAGSVREAVAKRTDMSGVGRVLAAPFIYQFAAKSVLPHRPCDSFACTTNSFFGQILVDWHRQAPRLPERREQQPAGRELDAPSRRHQTERHLPKPAMQWAGKNFVLVSSDTH